MKTYQIEVALTSGIEPIADLPSVYKEIEIMNETETILEIQLNDSDVREYLEGEGYTKRAEPGQWIEDIVSVSGTGTIFVEYSL